MQYAASRKRSNWLLAHPDCREFGFGLTGRRFIRKRRLKATYVAQMYIHTWFGTHKVTK